MSSKILPSLLTSFILYLSFPHLIEAKQFSKLKPRIIPNDLPGNWSYQGCYSDNVGSRTLQGKNYANGTAMTNEACVAFCDVNGFIYAGTEYSAECYCDNYLDQSTKASDGETGCNMACSGNTTQSCGGGSRLSLFWSGGKPPAGPATNPGPGEWTSMGCYNDSVGSRTLLSNAEVLGGPSNMSVLNCVNACGYSSYTYAGMEHAGECYCGFNLTNYGGPALDTRPGCNMQCNGNISELCGGNNRMNLYQFGVVQASNQTFQFASTYTGAGLASSTTGSSTSTSTTSSSQTLSSTALTTLQNTSTTSSSSSASLSASSSTNTSTTSSSSFSASSSASPAAAIAAAIGPTWNSMGCYSDSTGARTFQNNVQVVGGPNAMSHETCNDACGANNFKYAGTEYSGECWCDNKFNNGGQLATDGCNMACNGNKTQICGGSNRLTVFSFNILTTQNATSSNNTGSPASTITSTTSSSLPAATAQWYSLGCYNDSTATRTLQFNVAVEGGPAGLTHETCQASCSSLGHVLSGTEYSGECWCDDVLENFGGPALDGNDKCNMACNGNKSQTCGGPDRLTLFKFGIPQHNLTNSSTTSITLSSSTTTLSPSMDSTSSSNTTSSSPLASPLANSTTSSAPLSTTSSLASSTTSSTTPSATLINGWTLLGCYVDSTGARSLSANVAVTGGQAGMSYETCTTACKSNGFVYAGMEYAGECWCGNGLLNSAGPAPDGNAQCNMNCNGNSSQICGGPNRLTLFYYGNTPPSASSATATSSATSSASPSSVATGLPVGWHYSGCYLDTLAGRIMGNQQVDDQQTYVEQCIGKCTSQGFNVAGIEYGVQCFCDNYLRNSAQIAAADSECGMACPGKNGEKCGDGNRMSVYYNGTLHIYKTPVPKITGLPGDWTYKGCLSDAADQKSLPKYVALGNSNSPFACLSACAQFGYNAGGMEYGTECYCGDVGDVAKANATLEPEKDCTFNCPADPEALCGAGDRLTYYTWTGTSLANFSYPNGTDAGEYQFLIGGVIVPLMVTPGVNGKVVMLEKWGTGPANTTGTYELDLASLNDFSKAWRPLNVKTDIFCSAGLTLPDKVGRQINVGGWSGDSTYGIRLYTPDGSPGTWGTNDWEENGSELKLQNGRWYPTAMIMANGSIMVIGGESGSNGPPVPTIEVLPTVGPVVTVDWLTRTDPDNLYPFTVVLPSGGIFVGYYNEARILDEKTFATTKTLPNMPGSVNNPNSGRTYPLEGAMVLLPQYAPYSDPLTVLICGGSTPYVGNGLAIDNCISTQPEASSPQWAIEKMPSERVMSCMAGLPDGTYIILNGAHRGIAGFGLASDANHNAVLYDPTKPVGARMSMMANTTIDRFYHSEAVLLQDGRVLVSGSDPETPGLIQEYRVEVFVPPYLLSNKSRPSFTISNTDWSYGQTVTLSYTPGSGGAIKVSLLGAVSSTHGNAMGQRTIFPAVSCSGGTCSVTAPPNAHVSPPGWHQLFLLDDGVPSHSQWVRIGGDPGKLGNWPAGLDDFVVPGV